MKEIRACLESETLINIQQRLALRQQRHALRPQGEYCGEPSHRKQEPGYSGARSSPRK